MPIAEINELRDCLVAQLSPLKVYLFGSFADGSYDDDSDFDFYIVVDDSEDNVLALMKRAYKAVRGIKKRPVDIFVGTSSRFEQNKDQPTVENEVYRKGVLIYAV